MTYIVPLVFVVVCYLINIKHLTHIPPIFPNDPNTLHTSQ